MVLNNLSTIDYRYIAVTYDKIMHISQQLQWQNFDQTCAHERHPIPRPSGRAMGCLSWVIRRQMTAIYRERTAWWRHGMQRVSYRWPFARGIHRPAVGTSKIWLKSEALVFLLFICWTNYQVNGDLKHLKLNLTSVLRHKRITLIFILARIAFFCICEGSAKYVENCKGKLTWNLRCFDCSCGE